MATQFRLQRQQLADLKTIGEIDLKTLDDLIVHLRALNPLPLQPKQLRQEFLPFLKEQSSVADALLRQMLSLHGLIGQMHLSLDQVFAGLLFGIKNSDAKWTLEQMSAWRDREGKLRDLFSLDAVRFVAKALDLSYEYPSVLKTARIITDVRPVFTFDATGIDGAVVLHTLRIRFDSPDGNKAFSTTLDESDIRSLKEQCERALTKAETAFQSLTKGTSIRTIVSGRDEDENV